ncbi:MAG: hypothetical protein II625_00110 [Bacilli bacterium]|jgi:hypothetical protein|nr:hypothetical protein [Bacilli bacterium]
MQEKLLNKSGFERRADEIKFCIFVENLLIKYQRSVEVLDLMGMFSQLAGVTPTLINKLIQQVYIKDRALIPSKEEMLIVLKKKNLSMRQIRDKAGIHPNTQYRLFRDMQKNHDQIPDIKPRLNDEEYITILKFMEQIEKFKEI